MRIHEIRTLPGPNIYNYKPVVLMKLHLEDLTEKESYEIPGFIDRLLKLLPGLHDHHCAAGRPYGFIERLYEGTYFGHIVEHVAIELTVLAGVPVCFGKTLYAGEPGYYDVVVEYKAEKGTLFLLRTAVELVEALVKNDSFPLEEKIRQAKQIITKTELGPSTRAIVEAAKERGIPYMRLNEGSLVQLGYGKYLRRIQATIADSTKAIGVDIAGDKELTKRLLDVAAIPVPRGGVVTDEQEALDLLKEIGKPVVIKPYDGNQGRGVSLCLNTPAEVRRAFQLAKQEAERVIVEEYIEGRHYRIMVVGGQVVAAAERLPAHVIGDGKHTIEQLITRENNNPLRGEGHEKPLTKIKVDELVLSYLARMGRRLSDIPAPDELVYLRDNANLSTGGIAIDVTSSIHPENVRLCERIATVIGLDVCGIDLVLKDISQPMGEGGAVIEVNAAPGIRMHHFPSVGQPRNVGDAIVEMLFPKGSPSRIPIVAITGTNGKTTTTRMIGHVMMATGRTVGMTTTDGIYIGGTCIKKGDTTGPRSAHTILCDPSVEIAVLETARGGIVRSGLGYDWADVAVITNIQPDHIGQDGIEEIEDLIFIKSLVAERVRDGGTVVLNADDPNVVEIPSHPRMKKTKKQIVYFSLKADHPVIMRHLAEGGTAYFLKNDWIIEACGDTERAVMPVEDIPVTMYGVAQFHVANAMASIAACRAYGMSHERIARALTGFRSDVHNPGRANLYQVGQGYVMVDYGHNPDSFAAICKMAQHLPAHRVTGIIGVPGDRNNVIVETAARVAAHGFHRLIIKEDKDTRGRARGEIAEIMRKAVEAEVPEREYRIIYDECEALETALKELEPGEIVIVFYEKIEPILQVLQRWNAMSVSTVGGALVKMKSIAKV
ncbi:cyanophycin synthetase [Collibacillus ludicampi]|uniref:Cyanophycin synthetase n=1 Tax=Collibacillus ludicampi TaxID=2771369 RepID=A0AAV4LF09_9BACL|nr:cyanophycin synthetase [Collibacillus ludicampi]GIM46032.1 cyanophycin synthetase [Collibacillus ludicampi]